MRIKFEAHFVFVSINAFRFSQPSRFVLRDLLFLYLRSCVIFLTNGYFLLMNCDIINNFLIFAIILQKETSAMLHKGYRMLFNCLMFYL